MTYKRLINRNQLGIGGYTEDLPQGWMLGNVSEADEARNVEVVLSLVKHRRETLVGLGHRMQMLLGDLRRLEQDTIDEGSTCKYIAYRTGIDAEVVAAVLKEFIDW